MSEPFSCPNCRILLHVGEEQLGRQVRCPVCGQVTVFDSSAAAASPATGLDSAPWRPIGKPRPEEPVSGAGEESKLREFQTSKSSAEKSDWIPVPPKSSTATQEALQPPLNAADSYVIESSLEQSYQTSFDARWKVGFYTSLASAVGAIFPCACCFAFPFGPVALGIVGLVLTLTSTRGPKLVNYCLAGMGLALSLFWCALMFVGAIFGD